MDERQRWGLGLDHGDGGIEVGKAGLGGTEQQEHVH